LRDRRPPGVRLIGPGSTVRAIDRAPMSRRAAAAVWIECGTHGIKQLRVPWAEPGSQFTALFERLAIDLLRECSITGGGPLAAHQLGRGLRDQGARGQARPGPAEP